MAIQYLKNISSPVPIYKQDYLEILSDDNSVVGIELNIKDINGVVLLSTYSPTFNGTSVFNTENIYSCVLNSYDGVLYRVGSGTYINNDANQEIMITEEVKEVYSDNTYGNVQTSIRYLIKSTDNLLNIRWSLGGIDKGAFLNYNDTEKIYRYAFKDQIVPISIIKNRTTSIGVFNNIGLITTLVSGKYIKNFNLDLSEYTSNLNLNSPDLSNDLNIVIDNKNYRNKKTLYFINRYGGWEWANFIDYDRKIKANKNSYTFYTDRYNNYRNKTVTDSHFYEYQLYGRILNDANLEYLFDLVTSPIVIDENSNELTVKEDSFELDNELQEYSISVITKNENAIKY